MPKARALPQGHPELSGHQLFLTVQEKRNEMAGNQQVLAFINKKKS